MSMTDEELQAAGRMQSPNFPEWSAPAAAPAPEKKKPGWIKLVAVVVAVAVAAGGFLYWDHSKKVAAYNEAVALIDKAEYSAAIAKLESIGNFEDAMELKDYCRKCNSYNEAIALVENEKYSLALQTFEQLGDFAESKEKAEECRAMIALVEKYDNAMEMFEEGSYAGAKDLFAAAKGIKDSKDYITLCKNALNFDDVISLMEAGSFTEAVSLADGLDIDSLVNLPDYDENYEEWTRYFEAVNRLEQGHRYEAFKIFDGLGNFANSKDMAAACPLEIPGNKVLYRNDLYKGASLSITIITPNDGIYNYLKFYADNGDLMFTVFVKPNSNYNVQFPAGTFAVNMAAGTGAWYGEEDMFGDEGYYQRMSLGDNEGKVTLRSGSYRLDLRTDRTTGSTVDSEGIGRGEM